MLENTGSNSPINFTGEALLKISGDTVPKQKKMNLYKLAVVRMVCNQCTTFSLQHNHSAFSKIKQLTETHSATAAITACKNTTQYISINKTLFYTIKAHT